MKTFNIKPDSVQKGSLILVNSSLPLQREPGKEELFPVRCNTGDILLERQTARMFLNVMVLLNCGREIVPVSGYRTMAEQQKLYESSIYQNGNDFTQKFVAMPGCSEHQTGLAIDMAENNKSIDELCPDFPYEGICQAFREKAVEYGFIERYPTGREEITGIAHEPWHFRYVGYPHSRLITENDATLEEYISYLRQYQNKLLVVRYSGQNFRIYFVKTQPDQVLEIEIPDHVPCQISGNNEDGIIVTIWENVI